MTTQLTFADTAEMNAATEQGIHRGYANAQEEWKRQAKWVLYRYAQTHETFTVNDLREQIVRLPIRTQDGRALGGVVKAAQKARIIEPTGEKISSVRGHKSQIEVWRSLVFKKGI